MIALVVGTLAGCKSRVHVWPDEMRTVTPDGIPALVAAERGHPVLFVLYATWCKDCMAELPVLDRLHDRYGTRSLSIVALSIDEDPEDFAELIPVRPRWMPLVRVAPLDESTVTGSVHAMGGTWTGSIPYVALFDRSGTLLHEWPAGKATEMLLGVAISAAL